MVTVVIERVFTTPRTARDAASPTAEPSASLLRHGVRPQLHCLARDGMRCTDVFEAPDPDAVRQVIAAGASLPGEWWSASVHPGPDDLGSGPPVLQSSSGVLAVVDRSFPARVEFGEIQAKAKAGASCLEMYRIRYLRSYFAAGQQRMVCLYEAPDLESVRVANQKNGLPFDRVWGAWAVGAANG